MQLAGARVVVTGSSRGIGETLARSVAAKGAHVALVARSDDVITKLAADLGGDAYPADLARTDQLGALIARIERDGPIDVLVNNAGIDVAAAFAQSSDDDIRDLLTLNLVSPVLLSRFVLPGMLERDRGHIVNVSSLSASIATPGLAAYATSKAGLSHFTAALRAEVKGTAVRTTLVEMGPVATTMYGSVTSYTPTKRAFQRVRHLGFLPVLDVDKVAGAITNAIEHDRRHVRLPRRDAMIAMMSEAPRRIGEWLLIGQRPRPQG
jgi:uncharacterized protein